jgi:hypothetical protein
MLRKLLIGVGAMLAVGMGGTGLAQAHGNGRYYGNPYRYGAYGGAYRYRPYYRPHFYSGPYYGGFQPPYPTYPYGYGVPYGSAYPYGYAYPPGWGFSFRF